MKRVLYGLVAGVLVCSAAYVAFIPVIKKQSFYSGYDAGNKNGVATGTAAGMEEGMAKMQAVQHAQQEQDNIAAAEKHHKAVQRAHRRPAKVEKPVQNWHVIDNRIADPITD